MVTFNNAAKGTDDDGRFAFSHGHNELVFRRTGAMRTIALGLAAFMVVCLFIIVAGWTTDPAYRHQDVASAVLIMSLLTLPVALFFLRLAGPREVHFNTAQHTYRYVNGWPLFSRTLTGGWEDVSYFYVERTVSNYKTSYLVRMVWKNKAMPYSRKITLGIYRQFDTAAQWVTELTQLFGLPSVTLAPRDG